MKRYGIWLVVLLAWSAPVRAQEKKAPDKKAPAVKPLLETWEAGYFEGIKVGHVHTIAVETKKDGKTRIRTTKTIELTIKRYGSPVAMKFVQTTEETPSGKVRALSLVQSVSKDNQVTFKGTVEGKTLLLRTSLDEETRKLPWNDEVVGLYYQATVFERRKVKEKDAFTLVSYELPVLSAVTLRATVGKEEAVDRLVGKRKGDSLEIVREPVRLLRVDVVPDKLLVNGTEVALPRQRVWLDARLVPVREQFDMPGLGPITLYTTTKVAALKEGVAPEQLPDLGLNIAVPLKETLERPYDTTFAVYRVTLSERLDKVFVVDAGQKIRNGKGKTFELVVHPVREPGKDGEEPGEEYLRSNHFLDSKNARVQALAKKAVGGETDPWKKAQRIEKWVYDNMRISTSTGFPTAAQIARDLEGDCRQHALLCAAMCRAAGVPSRTALGLIYGRPEGRSPHFVFHMWTEVWVKGRWLGLDATLGKGGVSATHLKMAEHSWDRTLTLAPLLPISRTLGKLSIEIVRTR